MSYFEKHDLSYALEKQYEKDTLFCRLVNEHLDSVNYEKRTTFFEELAFKIHQELFAKDRYLEDTHEVQEAALEYFTYNKKENLR